jgi:hypothetical protein
MARDRQNVEPGRGVGREVGRAAIRGLRQVRAVGDQHRLAQGVPAYAHRGQQRLAPQQARLPAAGDHEPRRATVPRRIRHRL